MSSSSTYLNSDYHLGNGHPFTMHQPHLPHHTSCRLTESQTPESDLPCYLYIFCNFEKNVILTFLVLLFNEWDFEKHVFRTNLHVHVVGFHKERQWRKRGWSEAVAHTHCLDFVRHGQGFFHFFPCLIVHSLQTSWPLSGSSNFLELVPVFLNFSHNLKKPSKCKKM